MKLDKKSTGNKIIEHCQNKQGMKIDVKGFWVKIKTVADFKEACEFCGIEPIYFK